MGLASELTDMGLGSQFSIIFGNCNLYSIILFILHVPQWHSCMLDSKLGTKWDRIVCANITLKFYIQH